MHAQLNRGTAPGLLPVRTAMTLATPTHRSWMRGSHGRNEPFTAVQPCRNWRAPESKAAARCLHPAIMVFNSHCLPCPVHAACALLRCCGCRLNLHRDLKELLRRQRLGHMSPTDPMALLRVPRPQVSTALAWCYGAGTLLDAGMQE